MQLAFLSTLKKAFSTVDHNVLLERLDYVASEVLQKNGLGLISEIKSSQLAAFFQCLKISVLEVHKAVFWDYYFFIYTSHFHTCVRHSETHHVADDRNILHSLKLVEVLVSNMNYDIRILLAWMKANKLCVTLKTELMIFHPQAQKQL